MKICIAIALAIGALISAALLVLDKISGSELAWMYWEMPGIAAAVLFWGVAGSSPAVGVTICWLVNAVVYAAPVFVVLLIIKLIAPAMLSRKAA